jgi:hypothetical protein
MHGNLQVLGIELMILLIDRCKTIEKNEINKLKKPRRIGYKCLT